MGKTKRYVTILLMTILLGGCGNDEANMQEPKQSETVQTVTEQEPNEKVPESQNYTESKVIGSDAYQKRTGIRRTTQ